MNIFAEDSTSFHQVRAQVRASTHHASRPDTHTALFVKTFTAAKIFYFYLDTSKTYHNIFWLIQINISSMNELQIFSPLQNSVMHNYCPLIVCPASISVVHVLRYIKTISCTGWSRIVYANNPCKNVMAGQSRIGSSRISIIWLKENIFCSLSHIEKINGFHDIAYIGIILFQVSMYYRCRKKVVK